MKLLTYFLATVISLASFSQTTLGYNLKVGDEFKLKMVTGQEIGQDMMGQKLDIVQSITQGMKFKVLSKASDSYKMECTIYKIKYKMEIPAMMQSQSYDSEDPNQAASPLAVMGSMIDKAFTFDMTPSGKVTAVYGLDEIVDGMINSMGIPEAQKAQVKQQLEGFAGEKTMMGSMQQVLNFFPEGKVSKGDSWSTDTELASFGIKMVNEFNLSELSGSEAVINLSTTLEAGLGKQSMNGMDMTLEMSGTQTGSFKVDPKTGILISGSLDQDLKGKANAMGMDIPMTIKSTNTYSRD